jgi:hypothetical protein
LELGWKAVTLTCTSVGSYIQNELPFGRGQAEICDMPKLVSFILPVELLRVLIQEERDLLACEGYQLL